MSSLFFPALYSFLQLYTPFPLLLFPVTSRICFRSCPIVSPCQCGNFSTTFVQRVSMGDALVQFPISWLWRETSFDHKRSQVYDGRISSFRCTPSDKWQKRGITVILQLKCDAREGKWRGNWRMEWIASTLHTTSEHGVSSITTADAHTSAASSRLNWRPRRFKWTRPFRWKTKSGFYACAITFQLACTNPGLCRTEGQ